MIRLATLTVRIAILAIVQTTLMVCSSAPAALAAAPMVSQGKTVIQPSSSEPATETRTFALRSGGKLTVSNVNGYIKISAWDKNEVALTANFKPSIDDEHMRLEVNSTDKALELKADFSEDYRRRYKMTGPIRGGAQSCDMELKVPRQIISNINSLNGTVQISATSGKSRVYVVNGRIALEDVNGDIKVSIVNGDINGSIQNNRNLDLSTVNGSINVKLLKPNGNFRAYNVTGSIKLQTPGANDVEVKNLGGPTTTKATFGNGNAKMAFSTVNGSIVVQ